MAKLSKTHKIFKSKNDLNARILESDNDDKKKNNNDHFCLIGYLNDYLVIKSGNSLVISGLVHCRPN